MLSLDRKNRFPPNSGILGADLDDCIGAKPEAADLKRGLPLSAVCGRSRDRD